MDGTATTKAAWKKIMKVDYNPWSAHELDKPQSTTTFRGLFLLFEDTEKKCRLGPSPDNHTAAQTNKHKL